MTGTCSVHQRFDPLALDYLTDPYPTLAAVRAEAAAFYAPSVDMWVVTRHADIDAIFKDPATYSAAITQAPVFPLARQAQEILAQGFGATPTMSNCDPPKHTRIRAHNVKAFSARRIAVLEPKVRAKARELVAAITPGRTDLVPALTYPLPAYMIFTLIGFPDQDMDMLKNWCGNRMAFSWGRPEPDEQAEIAANMVRYWRYCQDFVARRARDPRDDFTSDLIRVHLADPNALSREEITNIAYGLSFAGHETTTNLTGNTLLRLLGDRVQWDELCVDPQAIPGAIEEILRYDTSVITWRRVTTCPTAIGQVEIPAGAKVLLLLGSAGRDPGRFPEPETFNIHRRDARAHLAFGKGIHYCFGARCSGTWPWRARLEDAAGPPARRAQLALRTSSRVELINSLNCCGHLCTAAGRHAETVTVWAALGTLVRHESLTSLSHENRVCAHERVRGRARRSCGR